MDSHHSYALVTGASTGLGKAFAIQCARTGKNVILVALPGEGLENLSREISSRFGVDAPWIELDLTENDAIQRLSSWALSKYRIDLLINNAGFGGTQSINGASFEYLDKMIKLNVRATSMLTYLLLPELKSHGNAYVLNVSSLIAYTPVPYKTFYPASKSFIYFFSRGLREEFKEEGIHVSVLMAGPMNTNPNVTKRIEALGWKGRFVALSPDEMARLAIKGLLNKRAVIIPGLGNKLSFLVSKILPASIRIPMLKRVFIRELKDGYGWITHQDGASNPVYSSGRLQKK